jgi:hypothetical protein
VQAQTDETATELAARHRGRRQGRSVKNILITRKGEVRRHRRASQAGTPRRNARAHHHLHPVRGHRLQQDGAKLPDTIVKQIVEMFSTNIDFRSDLKRGDSFNVVYETFWQDGEFVRAGRVLAGEFTNKRHDLPVRLVRRPASKQGGGYYSFDGKSLKKPS